MLSIQLYNEDCIEQIKNIPDRSIDLILTDPPYELDNHGGGKKRQWDNIQNNHIAHLSNGFNYDFIFTEFLRVCKTPNILVFCSNKQISKIMSWFENQKLSTTLLCWHKEGYVPFANGKHMSDVEFIVYVRGKNAHWNNNVDIKQKSKILKDNWRIKKKVHPTEKSQEILNHLLQLHSYEGDTVLDPFMGSGATGLVCQKNNRNFVGIEIKKEYFDVAKDKLNSTQIKIGEIND